MKKILFLCLLGLLGNAFANDGANSSTKHKHGNPPPYVSESSSKPKPPTKTLDPISGITFGDNVSKK